MRQNDSDQKARSATLTAAPRVMTAAAIARPLSKPLITGTPTGRIGAATAVVTGRGVAATAGAGRGAGDAAAGTLLEVIGAAAGGVEAATGAGAAAGAAFAAAGAATPAEGGVGSRTVGAAVGFGGKLMRTVSFLGCTLADSPGLGGAEPGGKLGLFSAIIQS
jgi:hypothetical protein